LWSASALDMNSPFHPGLPPEIFSGDPDRFSREAIFGGLIALGLQKFLQALFAVGFGNSVAVSRACSNTVRLQQISGWN